MKISIKNTIKVLIWIILIISSPARSLIIKQLLTYSDKNYNSTGTIIYRNYKLDVDVDVEADTIKTYQYIASNQSATQSINLETDIAYKSANMLFALVPRSYYGIKSLNYDISNSKILCTNRFLDYHYTSPSIQDCGTLIENPNLIYKEIARYSKVFNNYLSEHNLADSLEAEKKAQIHKAITGTYSLFLHENINMINNDFNNTNKFLKLAVSTINDLLLIANDFNATDQSITKEQFTKLQFLIFKAIEQARTVIFIPDCITQKNTNDIRLPIALINKVSLNENTKEITLNLMFCNKAVTDFNGFHHFVDARTNLLQQKSLVTEWEFIDYTLELVNNFTNTETDDISKNLMPLQYKFKSAQINVNDCINNLTNINDNKLSSETKALDNSELDNINIENVYLNKFLVDLLFNSQANFNAIKIKLLLMLHNDISTITAKKEIIQDILKHNNDNFKPKCTEYNRKCLMKYDCNCDKYWCCHRCHNNDYQRPKTCKYDKLKSYNITKLKCLICNYEQDFDPETFHSCIRCGTEFADYSCNLCKHLTDTTDNPYHCKDCGICRINGNRSFHCDVCGVCLDVDLRNNHKCRAGSAHEACFICLEDAFTGCSILPCSHKVHKSCIKEMMSNGITRCGVCKKIFHPKFKCEELECEELEYEHYFIKNILAQMKTQK
jgi:RING finger/CHY zinc finger protein 1